MKKPIIAIMYDFDKTLCTRDMQEYTFIPSIGMEAEEFWQRTSPFWVSAGVFRCSTRCWAALCTRIFPASMIPS